MLRHAAHNIADFLRLAAEDLREVSEDPRRDAEVLLAAVLECDRARLYAYGDHYIDQTARDIFCHYVERRCEGEPVAYILGQREFWSLVLKVNDSTLIPRPDTEILVETALHCCQQEQAHVIDLGTGCGAIALALAHERPKWQVDAVDAQQNAVDLAQLNARLLALPNLSVYRSHWFDAVLAHTAAPDGKFDMIVSNPPYIAADDPHLAQGDLRFEPLSALVAADEGYADLEAIARQACGFLNDGGLLLLEHGFGQGERLRATLRALGYDNVDTVRDYGGNERVTVAHWHPPEASRHG